MIWGCLIAVSAAFATFWSDVKGAVLALWACGLATGGLFLSMGAELLAVVQWIVCTVVAITFVFYSITFGEYGVRDTRKLGARLVTAILPVILGAGFALVLWAGMSPLEGVPQGFDLSAGVSGQILSTQELGRSFVHDHFLAVELLALLLFVVIVGAGVIARPDEQEKGGAA